MYRLLLPFFLFRLCWANTFWLLQFSLFSLTLLTSLWYVSFLTLLLTATLLATPLTALTQAKIAALSSPAAENTYQLLAKLSLADHEQAQGVLTSLPASALPPDFSPLPKKLSLSTLRSQKVFWLELFHQQPTHRDVLLNLSAISQTLGETTESEDYLRQAQEVDPNFFSN